jgi:curli production assembly/transport component CsgE
MILIVAPGTSSSQELELSGLIVDRTITINGHEFYRFFNMAYESSLKLQEYNLIVYEKPSARWGSLIWVETENKVLFQAFIHPGRAKVKLIAEDAAEIVRNNLFRLTLFKSRDNEDIANNGY